MENCRCRNLRAFFANCLILLNSASTVVAVELKSISFALGHEVALYASGDSVDGLDEIPEISERFPRRLLKPQATNYLKSLWWIVMERI